MTEPRQSILPSSLLETLKERIRGLRALLPESLAARLPSGQAMMPLGIGLAALIAVASTVWFWQGDENWRPLFGRQEQFDTAAVVNVLDGQTIPYQLHPDSGQILVPEANMAGARMQLAIAGITPKIPQGMELLDSDSALGRSQFMEKTRYNQGMEGELAKTIMTLNAVRTARVHIDIPERSAFMRGQSKASASVVLDLKPGMELDARQVNAVVHLVAGSRSELSAEDINVLDQYGTLLTGESSDLNGNNYQINHTRKLERQYIERILNLLEPVVGEGNIRVQVTADIDYSVVEKTSEGFDPAGAVIRSESVSSEADNSAAEAAGPAGGMPVGADNQQRQKSRSVRNFELGRTVSNIRQASGEIRKLSVAIVINSLPSVSNMEWPSEHLTQMNSLARDAVGFDEQRGDILTLHSLPFMRSLVGGESEKGLEAMVQDYTGKSLVDLLTMAAFILLLTCIALLIRVLMLRKRTVAVQYDPAVAIMPAEMATVEPEPSMIAAGQSPLALEQARMLANERPELIAHILKQWIKPE